MRFLIPMYPAFVMSTHFMTVGEVKFKIPEHNCSVLKFCSRQFIKPIVYIYTVLIFNTVCDEVS